MFGWAEVTEGSARTHLRAVWPRVQELQVLDLAEALEQPLARAVAAVIAGWEGRLRGVLALEHAG